MLRNGGGGVGAGCFKFGRLDRDILNQYPWEPLGKPGKSEKKGDKGEISRHGN